MCIVLLTSCATTKPTTTRDGNNFSFSSIYLPGFEISGVTATEEGYEVLYITSVKMFSNWEGGWTEGFYEASGKYIIETSGEQSKLTQIDPFELWDIVAGEIRFHDNYYRGDDGLWKVKNRIDRFKELSRVLINDMDFPKFSGDLETDLYPTLFPELYKFKKLEESGELPQAYYDSELEPKINRASDIKWRTDYTESVFPEPFWKLRDSGTLYRDALEAPDIFRSIYNLEQFFSNKELTI